MHWLAVSSGLTQADSFSSFHVAIVEGWEDEEIDEHPAWDRIGLLALLCS